MKTRNRILSLLLLPLVGMFVTEAKAESNYILLKNPNLSNILKVSVDPDGKSVSVERCFEHRFEGECQKVGKSVSIDSLNHLVDQSHVGGQYAAGGAVLGAMAVMGAMLVCSLKAKCSAVATAVKTKLFPNSPELMWLEAPLVAGGFLGGAKLGGDYGDNGLSQLQEAREIQAAIELALERNDQEGGGLVVETEVSINKILESYSLLQLLVEKTPSAGN